MSLLPSASASSSVSGSLGRPRNLASQEEVEEMRDVFQAFDKDSSGSVTTAELGLVLKNMNQNFSDVELRRIITAFDANGDGEIDFDEFLAMMQRQQQGRSEEDEMRSAFRVFDKDGDGTISAKELEIVMRALGENIDRETIDLMIESVDTDGNGQIDFEEFKQLFVDGPETRPTQKT